MNEHPQSISFPQRGGSQLAVSQDEADPADARGLFGREPPVNDDEIRAVIKQLEIATANIEQQKLLLKKQQTSLWTLLHENLSREEKFGAATSGLEKKWMHESQQLVFVSEDLTSEKTARFKSLENHATATIKSVSSIINAQLNAHDRELEAMGNLEDVVPKEQSSERYSTARIEKLSNILASLCQQEIRCRLDRIYLEATTTDPEALLEDHDSGEDHEEAIATLQASIPPLFSEINAVAEMAVNHVHRDPLIHAITQRNASISSLASSRQKDVSSRLSRLTHSAEDSADRLVQLHSFRTTLSEMQKLSEETMEKDSLLSPSKQIQQLRSSNLLRDRPHLEALLQNLHVPTAKLTYSSLLSQLSNVSNANHALESEYHSLISSHITNDSLVISKLQDACKNAKDISIHGDGRSIDEHIDDLSSRVGEVGQWIERMGGKVDEMSKGRDKVREAFVERWAGS